MENKRSSKKSCGELISPKAAADIAGVSMNTLREWDKRGLIDSYRTDGGHRRYGLESLHKYLESLRTPNVVKESIIYASITTEKDKNELDTRVGIIKSFCLDREWDCRVITDIGYGLKGSQKGMLELIGLIECNKVERLVIDVMDNIINIGFEVIKEICKWHNVDLVVMPRMESYRRKDMKPFARLSEAMIFDLKQELNSFYDYFEAKFDEIQNDEWSTVINDSRNAVFTKNENGECHLVSFKRFAYNENYVSGSLELRINDKQKETSYVIFNRNTESACISKYDSVLDLWHAVRAYKSLMHLQYEYGESGIFDDNSERLKSTITNILVEKIVGNVLFSNVDEFIDLLSVCTIEQDDIEDILSFIIEEDGLIEEIVEDMEEKSPYMLCASDLALRAVNCVRN